MNRRLRIIGGLLLAGALALVLGAAQMPKPEEVVTLRLEPLTVKAKPGVAFNAVLFATVKDGFHINSHEPTEEYLIPSSVELVNATGFKLEKADFPDGALKAFGFAPDEMLSVYEGVIRVPLKLRAEAGAAAGARAVKLAFHYQACNDQLCLRPAKRETVLTVQVQ